MFQKGMSREEVARVMVSDDRDKVVRAPLATARRAAWRSSRVSRAADVT